MKYILFCLLAAGIGACNNAEKQSGHTISNDSIKNAIGKVDTVKQIMKASAGLPSDSLHAGITTAESWRVSGFTDPEGFKRFFIMYKKWVADDTKDSIATHIKFPLRNCNSAAAFNKNFTVYFNNAVKDAVAKQEPDKFFANYNGAMVGDGQLWFSQIKNNYFVITINNNLH